MKERDAKRVEKIVIGIGLLIIILSILTLPYIFQKERCVIWDSKNQCDALCYSRYGDNGSISVMPIMSQPTIWSWYPHDSGEFMCYCKSGSIRATEICI